MMTHSQQRLLKFIHEYVVINQGVSPTHDEMKDALGLASKSNVTRFLVALETDNLITRTAGKHRSIRATAKGIRLISEGAAHATAAK